LRESPFQISMACKKSLFGGHPSMLFKVNSFHVSMAFKINLMKV
jgi:hypothetical protein